MSQIDGPSSDSKTAHFTRSGRDNSHANQLGIVLKEAEQNGRKGGKARAANLTSNERSEAARRAAETRWGKKYVDATHFGKLIVGDMDLEVAVLADGTRVINQKTIMEALGRSASSGRHQRNDSRPPFLGAQNLLPYFPAGLTDIYAPIEFRAPGQTIISTGFRAEILPMVCETYLSAREDGALQQSQQPAAAAAELLVRGLARVGIIALVDEATGYQDVRARDELAKILQAYVAPELQPWIKRFPDEFFEQIYRLQGWEFKPGTSKRTPYVGKLINQYIYDQLPPGVAEELRSRNPLVDGRRAHKHHQFLTEGTGNVHLDRQISTVTTLLRIADNKNQFESMFEKAFPPVSPKLPLVVEIDGEEVAL